MLTGQDCCKTQDEVDLFGGELGNYEGNLGTSDGGCVDNPFRWCDNLSNNDPNVLTFMSKAFANTVVRMALPRRPWRGQAPPGSSSRGRSSNEKPRRTAAGLPSYSHSGFCGAAQQLRVSWLPVCLPIGIGLFGPAPRFCWPSRR